MLNVLTKKIVGFILFSGVKIIPVIEGHKVFSFYVRRRKLEKCVLLLRHGQPIQTCSYKTNLRWA